MRDEIEDDDFEAIYNLCAALLYLGADDTHWHMVWRKVERMDYKHQRFYLDHQRRMAERGLPAAVTLITTITKLKLAK